MLDPSDPGLIRGRPCPYCALCGAEGYLLYEKLADQLFGTEGLWNLVRCPNPKCGLVWLNPMPREEDIGKAYARYYTHQSDPQRSPPDWPARLKSAMVVSYHFLLRATPIHGERKRLESMYLERTSTGRVLDVGCGDGSRLARLRTLGWKVEGQELDPEAAAHARFRHGITVHLGPLENLGFPDGTFDAVIASHVIEHVHDPVGLIRKCNQLLKTGGRLVIVTPNLESYGHQVFGSCWRGLEPPRHLHLFSLGTLQGVVARAGLTLSKCITSAANAEAFVRGSLQIRDAVQPESFPASRLTRGVLAVWYQIWSEFVHSIQRNSGEECVLIATK